MVTGGGWKGEISKKMNIDGKPLYEFPQLFLCRMDAFVCEVFSLVAVVNAGDESLQAGRVSGRLILNVRHWGDESRGKLLCSKE